MRLLLDTHILLAILKQDTARFDARTRAMLAAPAGAFHASVASLWEIAIKYRLGKLQLGVALANLPRIFKSAGMSIIPITEAHALAGIDPEPATRDPFDRLLLAQCRVEGLQLVTVDRALMAHPMVAR